MALSTARAAELAIMGETAQITFKDKPDSDGLTLSYIAPGLLNVSGTLVANEIMNMHGESLQGLVNMVNSYKRELDELKLQLASVLPDPPSPLPLPPPLPPPSPSPSPPSPGGACFGIYDHSGDPGGDWKQITSAIMLTNMKMDFIDSYNSHGLKAIKSWTSGNCCFAFSSTKRLKIDTTLPFPKSIALGTQQCNPSSGYNEEYYGFTSYPTLSASSSFSETGDCADSKNPGLYYKTGSC